MFKENINIKFILQNILRWCMSACIICTMNTFCAALAQALLQGLAGARAYYPSYPYAGVRYLFVLYEKNPPAALLVWEELWKASLSS